MTFPCPPFLWVFKARNFFNLTSLPNMNSLKKVIKNPSCLFHWKIINIRRQNKHKNYVRKTLESNKFHRLQCFTFRCTWRFQHFFSFQFNCALEITLTSAHSSGISSKSNSKASLQAIYNPRKNNPCSDLTAH